MTLTKDKLQEFWNKNKKRILILGGAIVLGGIGGSIIFSDKENNNDISPHTTSNWVDPYKEILESFGAVYHEDSSVPYATREVVEKFLDERGDIYQIDIFEDDTSAVWIRK